MVIILGVPIFRIFTVYAEIMLIKITMPIRKRLKLSIFIPL